MKIFFVQTKPRLMVCRESILHQWLQTVLVGLLVLFGSVAWAATPTGLTILGSTSLNSNTYQAACYDLYVNMSDGTSVYANSAEANSGSVGLVSSNMSALTVYAGGNCTGRSYGVSTLNVSAPTSVTLMGNWRSATGGPTFTANLIVAIAPAAKNFTSLTASQNPVNIFGGDANIITFSANYSDYTSRSVTPQFSATNFLTFTPTTIGTQPAVSAKAAWVAQSTTENIIATFTEGGVTKNLALPINITARAATAQTIAISGPTSLNENAVGRYAATVTFNDGQTVTGPVVWSGANIDPDTGILTAPTVTADTTTQIRATYSSGLFAILNVAIKKILPRPTQLNVTASTNTLTEGSTAQLQGIAIYSDGISRTTQLTIWTIDTGNYTFITRPTIDSNTGVLMSGRSNSDSVITVRGIYTDAGVQVTGEVTINIRKAPSVILPAPQISITPALSAAPDTLMQVAISNVPNASTYRVCSGSAQGSYTSCTLSTSPYTFRIQSGQVTYIAVKALPLDGSNYAESAYSNELRVIALQTQSLTLNYDSSQNLPVGSTFNVFATASSGLPVVINSLSTLVCTNSGSIVTVINSGVCRIEARQVGDTIFAPVTAQGGIVVNVTGSSTLPAPIIAITPSGIATAGTAMVLSVNQPASTAQYTLYARTPTGQYTDPTAISIPMTGSSFPFDMPVDLDVFVTVKASQGGRVSVASNEIQVKVKAALTQIIAPVLAITPSGTAAPGARMVLSVNQPVSTAKYTLYARTPTGKYTDSTAFAVPMVGSSFSFDMPADLNVFVTVKASQGGQVSAASNELQVIASVGLPIIKPRITSISPLTAKLNKLTQFTVGGEDLTDAMGFTIEDCETSNYEVGDGTTTLRTFECTPRGNTGMKAATVKDQPGGSILSNGFTIAVGDAEPPNRCVAKLTSDEKGLTLPVVLTVTGKRTVSIYQASFNLVTSGLYQLTTFSEAKKDYHDYSNCEHAMIDSKFNIFIPSIEFSGSNRWLQLNYAGESAGNHQFKAVSWGMNNE